MFVKSLTHICERRAPIVEEIIEQSVTEDVFLTPYLKESTEILLSAAHALFDNPDVHWMQNETMQKATAFLTAAERIGGAAQNI